MGASVVVRLRLMLKVWLVGFREGNGSEENRSGSRWLNATKLLDATNGAAVKETGLGGESSGDPAFGELRVWQLEAMAVVKVG